MSSAASKIVRTSKFRHVYADQAKPESMFTDLELSPSTGDSNVRAATGGTRGGCAFVACYCAQAMGRLADARCISRTHCRARLRIAVFEIVLSARHVPAVATRAVARAISARVVRCGQPCMDALAHRHRHPHAVHPLQHQVLFRLGSRRRRPDPGDALYRNGEAPARLPAHQRPQRSGA